MKKITKAKLDKLIAIGEEFGCELMLPPFNDSLHPFYFIGKIKNVDGTKLTAILDGIDKLKLDRKIVDIKSKKYVEIICEI